MIRYGLSPRATRRILLAVSLLLTVLLCGLLGVLGNLIHSGDVNAQEGPIAGLRALHVIVGPGVGATPYFSHPMGAAFGHDGRIYVADTGNNRIVVFNSRAKYLFQFGGFGVGKPAPGGRFSWEPGRFNYPTDVAVDVQGNVYVADFRNDQIQVFDADGKFLRVFPDRMKVVGKGASGQDGTGIAVTSLDVEGDRVYATDAYQVVVFDTSGHFVEQFGKPGAGRTDLDHPNGVAVAGDSTIAISDSDHDRVIGVAPDGTSRWVLGKSLGSGFTTAGPVASPSTASNPFEVPRGLVEMDDGSLLVADAMACRLVRISSEGKLAGVYGQRGTLPGELNFPTDVDSLGRQVLVAEKGSNRVQVVVIDEQ